MSAPFFFFVFFCFVCLIQLEWVGERGNRCQSGGVLDHNVLDERRARARERNKQEGTVWGMRSVKKGRCWTSGVGR